MPGERIAQAKQAKRHWTLHWKGCSWRLWNVELKLLSLWGLTTCTTSDINSSSCSNACASCVCDGCRRLGSGGMLLLRLCRAAAVAASSRFGTMAKVPSSNALCMSLRRRTMLLSESILVWLKRSTSVYLERQTHQSVWGSYSRIASTNAHVHALTDPPRRGGERDEVSVLDTPHCIGQASRIIAGGRDDRAQATPQRW